MQPKTDRFQLATGFTLASLLAMTFYAGTLVSQTAQQLARLDYDHKQTVLRLRIVEAASAENTKDVAVVREQLKSIDGHLAEIKTILKERK